jgi:protein SCO1/2
MNIHSRHRRRALQWGALASLLAAAGSQRQTAQPFHGIDITGATYGTSFLLDDADGRERTLADFKGKAVMMFSASPSAPTCAPPP